MKTEKRYADVGEKILIVNSIDDRYKNGEVFIVKRLDYEFEDCGHLYVYDKDKVGQYAGLEEDENELLIDEYEYEVITEE